jgi:hypothetical protein
VRWIAALLAALALGAEPARADPGFADWTSVGAAETPGRADGTLLGASVSLAGGTIGHTSTLDGSGPNFANPAFFTPPLAHSDRLDLYGTAAPGSEYTLTFGAPVQDPVLHVGNLASIFEFPPNTRIDRLSGDPTFELQGNTVRGHAAGSTDSSGTIRLAGQYSSVTFTATQNFVGSADGIELQVGASPVPPVTPVTPVTPQPTPSPSPSPEPTTPTLPPAQPPVAGVRVGSQLSEGTVTVKLPGGTQFLPLTGAASLPVGSVVDARRGATELAASDGRGGVASAVISAGIFAIRQAEARGAIAEVALRTPPGKTRACATGPRKGVIRKLSIVAKGVFRTRAAKAVVKGRNASWTVSDRCDGTLTRVKRGHVAVKSGKRTVNLAAGRRLLIKARLFGAKQRR